MLIKINYQSTVLTYNRLNGCKLHGEKSNNSSLILNSNLVLSIRNESSYSDIALLICSQSVIQNNPSIVLLHVNASTV